MTCFVATVTLHCLEFVSTVYLSFFDHAKNIVDIVKRIIVIWYQGLFKGVCNEGTCPSTSIKLPKNAKTGQFEIEHIIKTTTV